MANALMLWTDYGYKNAILEFFEMCQECNKKLSQDKISWTNKTCKNYELNNVNKLFGGQMNTYHSFLRSV